MKKKEELVYQLDKYEQQGLIDFLKESIELCKENKMPNAENSKNFKWYGQSFVKLFEDIKFMSKYESFMPPVYNEYDYLYREQIAYERRYTFGNNKDNKYLNVLRTMLERAEDGELYLPAFEEYEKRRDRIMKQEKVRDEFYYIDKKSLFDKLTSSIIQAGYHYRFLEKNYTNPEHNIIKTELKRESKEAIIADIEDYGLVLESHEVTKKLPKHLREQLNEILTNPSSVELKEDGKIIKRVIKIADLLKLDITESEMIDIMIHLGQRGIEVTGTKGQNKNILDEFFKKNDMNLVELPSPKEQKEMLKEYNQTRDENLRNRIFESNYARIKYYSWLSINKFPNVEYEDIFQYTCESFLLSIEKYNPSSTQEFAAKLSLDLERYIKKMLSAEYSLTKSTLKDTYEKVGRMYDEFGAIDIIESILDISKDEIEEDFEQVDSLDEEIVIEGIVEKTVEDKLRKEAVEEALSKLTDSQRTILNIRFNVEDNNYLTYKEIGEKIGISGQYARQVEKKGFRTLRQPAILKGLKGYDTSEEIIYYQEPKTKETEYSESFKPIPKVKKLSPNTKYYIK